MDVDLRYKFDSFIFSVVIPVYNAEDTLAECLDSVLSQTIKDIEVICVNDGSSDNSLKVLQEYATKDSRVKVLSHENRGVGYTRNVGLKNAKGRYIICLDSDDRIAECDAFYKIYQRMNSDDLDLLIFKWNRLYWNGEKFYRSKVRKFLGFYVPYKFYNKVFSGKDALPYISKIPPYLWSKCIKNSFLKKFEIYCDENLPLGEDQMPSIVSCAYAKRIAILDDYIVDYRVHNKTKRVRAIKSKTAVFNDPVTLNSMKIYYGIKDHFFKNGKIEKISLLIDRLITKAFTQHSKLTDEAKATLKNDFCEFINDVNNYKGWWNRLTYDEIRTSGYYLMYVKIYLNKILYFFTLK